MAREFIAAQLAIVASLTPGSDEHRAATNVLLLLQDGLALLVQTRAMVKQAKAIQSRRD